MRAEELPRGEAHLYFATPDSASSAALESLVTDVERAQIARHRVAEDRRTRLLARAMLRALLARYGGQPPTAWRFAIGPHGRPELTDGASLRFSVAHTSGLVACVLTPEADVGVDVESCERQVLAERIARRFFGAEEVAALEGLPEPARRRRFFELWVLKESYVKARGIGVGLGLRDSLFQFPDGEHGRPQLASGNGADWRFTLLFPTSRHAAAVAVHGDVRLVDRGCWTPP